MRMRNLIQAPPSLPSSSLNTSDRSMDPLMNDEESPFSNSGQAGSFVLYLEPILNTYWQSYQNVITLDHSPPGPLGRMVTTISASKLSPFQSASVYASPFYNGSNCIHVLLRYPVSRIGGVGSWAFKNSDNFMGADDIPSVLSYLQTHGYKVEVGLSRMLFDSPVTIGSVSDKQFSGNRRMIAMVSYGL